VAEKLDYVQLIDFLRIAFDVDVISRNEIYMLGKELREMKNITKKKLKESIPL
jgi:hypothetical protein